MSDITEQFFEAFGIKAKKVKCDKIKTANICICLACPHYKNIDGETGQCLNVGYPEITAEKLLELVYIIGVKPYGFLYINDTYSTNINSRTDIILVEADDFREGVLMLAIQPRVALRIKKQVRALFKGEE